MALADLAFNWHMGGLFGWIAATRNPRGITPGPTEIASRLS
jgi:hypothetical protein